MSGSDAKRERWDGTAVLALVMRHGRTATAFRALGADLCHWFATSANVHATTVREATAQEVTTHEATALVAYAAPRGAWVAAGEPVAAQTELVEVAERFMAAAHTQRRRVSFFATEGRLASSPKLQRRLLGEQPVWDPREWADHRRAHRSLREQIRRARAKHVVVTPLSAATLATPPVAEAVRALTARWRATRSMASMGFLVTIDLESGGSARRHLAAWQHGQLVALLSMAPVPARDGWLLEHLLRDPDAPNGTLELLVDHAMSTLAADHVPWATLGLAPLHGAVDPWLRRVRRWSTPLFNFEGLAAFKRKLRPSRWEPIYLAWPVHDAGWRALLDGLRAFAGGSLWRFGLHTLLRGPSPLLLLLSWLLVPWALALAVAPTTPWFPSVAVHAGWVAFDGLLLLALHLVRRAMRSAGAISRRRVARLATAVAVAVSLDALLTTAQAVLWNAPRVSHWSHWLVLAVACAGPAVTAPMLWGTARRLRVLAHERPRVATLNFPA